MNGKFKIKDKKINKTHYNTTVHYIPLQSNYTKYKYNKIDIQR